MRKIWWVVALALIVPVLAMSQVKIEKLAVNGHTGSIPVKQIDGRNYVQVGALAQLVNGVLSFRGNQVTLTLTASQAATPEKKVGLSRDFLRAGIEELSTIREWRSTLAIGIENQFPVTPVVLSPYETAATTNLGLAQVAATTEADHQAAQSIANEYQKMKQLSDNFLAQRAAATYINANALSSDTLNQSVIACGTALEAMLASGQFTDDATCH